MLTDMQTAWVREFVATGDSSLAAELAGYSPTIAKAQGWRHLHNRAVMAAVAAAMESAKAQAGVIGVRVLRRIAEDSKVDGARVTAARTLLEYAGLIGRQAGDAVKDPAEMSTAELRQLLAKVDSEIASRAKPVNGPESSPIPQQVLDILAD
jgi:DNA-binding MarR family transcriptional regulator